MLNQNLKQKRKKAMSAKCVAMSMKEMNSQKTLSVHFVSMDQQTLKKSNKKGVNI